jgi:REP element-mobilizing transposase RayT
MEPRPFYDATAVEPAYSLRYSWAGWPSSGELPAIDASQLLSAIARSWENDGLRLLEHAWSRDCVQLTFSTKPHVSPVFVAARAKGRLQYQLRQAGQPCTFSRKVSLKSIGKNTREAVEQYIRSQIGGDTFADPKVVQEFRSLHMSDPKVDLSAPSESARGRYWYNLHLVLVAVERCRSAEFALYQRMRQGCVDIAAKKGYYISELSIMPDHLHAALRGNIDHSPAEIAGYFQNNLAYLLGQVPWWNDGYYVGTFSEYDMRAVRRTPE